MINWFGHIRKGWAYDLKSVSAEMIAKRALRTGDDTWQLRHKGKPKRILDCHAENVDTADNLVWGWNDEHVSAEIKLDATIENQIE